jgi:hypothetical protein
MADDFMAKIVDEIDDGIKNMDRGDAILWLEELRDSIIDMIDELIQLEEETENEGNGNENAK